MRGRTNGTLWQAVAITFLVAFFAADALAQAEDYGRQRGYMGVGLAYAEPDFDGFNSNSRKAESTFGLDVRAGYRWRYVAAELNYQFYTRFDVTGDEENKDSFRGMTIGPNVKAYPLSGRFQPYALVGGGFQHYNNNPVDDDNAGMLRFGGGIELYVAENLCAYVEGSYVLGISSDLRVAPFIGGIQIHLN